MSNIATFLKGMIVAGQRYVDILDSGMNDVIGKRDNVLQRDAQLGLILKLMECVEQLPQSEVSPEWLRAQVLEILSAEALELVDPKGLAAEIQATLFSHTPDATENNDPTKV